MVDLKNIPRTDAETLAAKLLVDIAEVGEVYSKLFRSQPTSELAAQCKTVIDEAKFSDVEEYFLREGLKSFVVMENTINDITDLVGEKLMAKIDEFNHVCLKVNEQYHKREQVLQDEGWARTADGWKRDHCEIKNKK